MLTASKITLWKPKFHCSFDSHMCIEHSMLKKQQYETDTRKYCSLYAVVCLKGRRSRHLPWAPPFWGPPWGATHVNFPYLRWKTYYSLIKCTTKQIIN